MIFRKFPIVFLLLIRCLLINAQTVQYLPQYTDATFAKTINTSLPVGKIEGSYRISASGSANYNIPIKLPLGTNAFAPSLVVSYNSQGGSGLLGQGWGLVGLSSISLEQQNLYYDNLVKQIKLTSADNLTGQNRYSLDGKRLISLSGNYGATGSTYTEESNKDIVVQPYFIVSADGPSWFSVIGRDGNTYEYGNTTDSKILTENNQYAISWLINKVTDANGNYYTYKYVGTKRDFRIDEINYTGNINSGLQTYNKIKFYYKEKVDSNRYYVGGNPVSSSIATAYILEKIEITVEGTHFKTYEFKYTINNLQSLLQEVIEYGSDYSSLNSTIFKYGTDNLTNTAVVNDAFMKSTLSADYFSGDYNGDGISDALILNKAVTDLTQIPHYINFSVTTKPGVVNPSGILNQLVNLGTIGHAYAGGNFISGMQTSDFNGDGRDDILIYKNTVINGGAARQIDDISIYYSKLDNAGNLIFDKITKNLITNSGYTFNMYNPYLTNILHVGDFDGDGTADYLTTLLKMNGSTLPSGMNSTQSVISFPSKQEFNKLISQTFSARVGTTYASNFSDADFIIGANQIKIIDFDGDGKSEIMAIRDNYCRIFSYNVSLNRLEVIHSSGYPTKWHTLYLGDFNGDGKTDMLTINTNNLQEIAYSTGTTFVKQTYPWFNTTNGKIVINDFNNDGKSDIANSFAPTSGSNIRTLRIFYALSPFNFIVNVYGLNVSNFSSSGNYGAIDYQVSETVFFDSDGDGNIEPTIQAKTSDFYWKSISLPINSKNTLLSSVIDGFGNKVDMNYETLTKLNNNVYEYSNANNQQNIFFNYLPKVLKAPIKVVSKTIEPNGLDGNTEINYYYKNAVFSQLRRGFIGFEKITTENNTLAIRTINENVIDNNKHIAYTTTAKIKSMSDNVDLSTKSYVYTLSPQSSNRYSLNLTDVSEINHVTGATLSETMQYDSYNNISSHTKNINNTEIINTQYSNFYAHHPLVDPSLPTNVITTTTRGSSTFTSKSIYEYANRNITKETLYDGNNIAAVTLTPRDAYGNILQKINSTYINGYTTYYRNIFTYDTKGRFITSKKNNINQTESYTYDIRWGKPISYTSVENLQTTYTYDAFGSLKTTLTPLGQTITNTSVWDIKNGNGTSTTDADNSLYYSFITHTCRPDIKTWFDKFERVRRNDEQTFNNNWISEVTTYDNKGNIKNTTAPFFQGSQPIVTTHNYDIRNRLINTQNSIGTNSINYTYSAGNTITTTTDPAGRQTSKTTDVTGKITASTDDGGTLNFLYNAQGKQIKVTNGGTELLTTTYDFFGNQLSLIDKNSGTHQYKYDAIGNLKQQIDNKGQTWTLNYDGLNRITQKTGPEGTTTYEYYTSGNGLNQLKKVTGFSGVIDEYEYDAYSRQTKHTKKIDYDVQSVSTLIEYDNCNNITKYTYPTGFVINKNYDANGFLLNIKNQDNTKTIFSANTMNVYGEYSNYTLGNGKNSNTIYDIYGKPKKFSTPNIQDLEYEYNDATGNITKRTDYLKLDYDGNPIFEEFEYDNLDRLTSSKVSLDYYSMDVEYTDNGNITYKRDVGVYTYDPQKINAVVKVRANKFNSYTTNYDYSLLHKYNQNVSYTPFNQPNVAYVNKNNIVHSVEYLYGSDYQRVRSRYRQDLTTKFIRFYLDNAERNIIYNSNNSPSGTIDVNYISVGGKIVCIAKTENNSTQYLYTYTDNLGSILTVTDEQANIVAEQNFDAWGNHREPNEWFDDNGASAMDYLPWLYRGYTGHEHLPAVLQLINMNGRLYDPALARFLSPDNYVQDPYSTQGYNSYTYVLNNPLKYDDPSGQIAPLAIAAIIVAGALVSGGVNVYQNWGAIKAGGFGTFLKAFGIGAFVGVVSTAAGMATGGMLAPIASGWGGTFLAGAIGGALSSVITTPISGHLNGKAFGTPMPDLKTYIRGAAFGFVLGGVGAVASKGISNVIANKAATKPVSQTQAPANIADEVLPEETIQSIPAKTIDQELTPYKLGRIGEEVLEGQGFSKRTWNMEDWGGNSTRISDGYKIENGLRIAAESKVGYQALTDNIRRQLYNDYLLLQNNAVDKVQWYFFTSPRTGLVGGTAPLINTAKEYGFEIFINNIKQ